MKKILIVTYYWPPSGGAAVQRWLSFANNLVEKDYNVHVLTVDEKYATYQLLDESLLSEVDPKIKVYRTKTREPFKLFTFFFGKKNMPKPAFANETNSSFAKKVSRFIRGNFFIPDPRKGWKSFAVKEATKIIKTENITSVITAGPPHSTHFIGKDLKQNLNIFWIADFHDLWTDVIYYDMLFHLPIVKRIDKRLEKNILESTDLIITVGGRYKQKLLFKSKDITAEKIKILRIGYDEKLFEHAVTRGPQAKFTITYTGTIADFYEPQVFIDALAAVRQQFPEVSFALQFAGVLSSGIKDKIMEAGLATILQEEGYVSHKEAIDFLKKSTVLLLVNPVTKDEEMVIPGKLYEYLAAAKPIINITRSTSETASIVSNCKAGRTFNRTQKAELQNYLTGLVTEWKLKKTLDIMDNASDVVQYSRGAITGFLVDILEANYKTK